jgi:hypothetical protein
MPCGEIYCDPTKMTKTEKNRKTVAGEEKLDNNA